MLNFDSVRYLLRSFEHLHSLLVLSESVEHIRSLEHELLVLGSDFQRLLEILRLDQSSQACLLSPRLVVWV